MTGSKYNGYISTHFQETFLFEFLSTMLTNTIQNQLSYFTLQNKQRMVIFQSFTQLINEIIIATFNIY